MEPKEIKQRRLLFVDIEDKIPFPQADDFEKIVRIVNIDDESRLIDKDSMSRYLDDISPRQVQYYLSACMYLNIIDEKKKFTEEGMFLREQNNANQIIELIRLILSIRIFGMVYFSEKYLGVKFTREDIKNLMREHTKIDNDAVIHRRAQTVLKWIEWVNSIIL